MRDQFPGFFQPTDQWLDELWKNALVVVDTNILLNFYRYGAENGGQLFDILERFKSEKRFWIPHRVAYEFCKRRRTVIEQQEGEYDLLVENLNEIIKKIKSAIPDNHSVLKVGNLKTELIDLANKWQANLKSQKDLHPKILDGHDPLLVRITELTHGCVGDQFTPEKETQVIQEAKRRFEKRLPPGVDDESKTEILDKCGDYFIWKQILEYLDKEEKLLLIFVTDDEKCWFNGNKQKRTGPHPDLLNELKNKTGASGYFYNCGLFLERALAHYGIPANPNLIKEAVEVREKSQTILDPSFNPCMLLFSLLGIDASIDPAEMIWIGQLTIDAGVDKRRVGFLCDSIRLYLHTSKGGNLQAGNLLRLSQEEYWEAVSKAASIVTFKRDNPEYVIDSQTIEWVRGLTSSSESAAN